MTIQDFQYWLADATVRAQIGFALGLIALALWIIIFNRAEIQKPTSRAPKSRK